MRLRLTSVLPAAALVMMAAALPRDARGQSASESVRLLDVPFLPQSEALCGGAAAAMVMRFWGTLDVYADAFAHLVDAGAGGIRGEDLIQDLEQRGWQAVSFRGDAALVQEHLANRRPPIVLIEDRPGRFHYVVVIGWTSRRVIVHDPARAPFRVFDEGAFLRAWSRSGFWTLLVMPGDDLTTRDEPTAPVRSGIPGRGLETAPHECLNTPRFNCACSPMLDEGVRLAGTGQLEDAQRVLEAAVQACPHEPGPWRELAGLHALRREWRAAAAHAREALARSAADEHSSRILATSLFLTDETDAALEAWNRLGQPVIDLVNVTGLERTRYAVAADALRLEPRTLLTSSALRAGRRRLSELPTALTSRVFYTPKEDGRADVEAVIVERPLVPTGLLPLFALGARSLTDREISVALASPTGGGEVIGASWRWWERRPRVALTFTAPSPLKRIGGVWQVGVFSERQTYRSATEFEEERRGASLTIADWASAALRWEVSVGLGGWSGLGTATSIAGILEARVLADRLTLRGGGAVWAAPVSTATASVNAEWRSATAQTEDVWLGRGGLELVSHSAPLALWPGAGTGQARHVLLRAHSLLDDGVIGSGVFGRTLAHGGVEWRRWMRSRSRPWRVAPATFLDIARAGRVLSGFDNRTHVDAGMGLRLGLPGAGVLRLDLARGLRDGSTALSVGWTK